MMENKYDLVYEDENYYQYVVGDYVENCNYHPSIVVESDGDEILALDLVTGAIGSHSAYHCLRGALIPKKDICAYLCGDKGGYASYMLPTVEEFVAFWRSSFTAYQDVSDEELAHYYNTFREGDAYKFFARNRKFIRNVNS
jgi:hypothetical protein